MKLCIYLPYPRKSIFRKCRFTVSPYSYPRIRIPVPCNIEIQTTHTQATHRDLQVRNFVGEPEHLVDGRYTGAGPKPHHGHRPQRSSANGSHGRGEHTRREIPVRSRHGPEQRPGGSRLLYRTGAGVEPHHGRWPRRSSAREISRQGRGRAEEVSARSRRQPEPRRWGSRPLHRTKNRASPWPPAMEELCQGDFAVAESSDGGKFLLAVARDETDRD
jgi:hypothetical protein